MTGNRIAAHFEPQESLTGKLLVASPRIAVRHPFGETVILVLQDTIDGVFGVALNRPASPEMHMAWNDTVGGKSLVSDHLVAGGPVQGPVLAIHDTAELGEVELQNGLFVSVQKDAIDRLGEQSRYDLESPYLIVMGAINWTPQQLWQEIEQGFWFVHEAESDLVFSEPDLLWEYAIESYGEAAIKRLTGLRELPSSPLLN